MSDIAILTATAQRLIDNLGDWEDYNCKPMPDERPDPVANVHFCSVHITERQTVANITHGTHRELWGIGVTVSKRIEAIPRDRVNQSVYLHHLQGISPVMQRIIYQIHNRWGLMNEINDAIPTDPELPNEECFLTPLYMLNRTPKLTMRDEEWWHGTHNQVPRNRLDGHVGVSMTAYFGNMMKETILVPEDCPPPEPVSID